MIQQKLNMDLNLQLMFLNKEKNWIIKKLEFLIIKKHMKI